MSLAAYIHIPFCSYKCDFCDFTAFAGLEHLVKEYCQVLCQEIIQRAARLRSKRPLSSVYYGGGTPGLIGPQFIASIHQVLINEIGLAPDAELTLETTPQVITSQKASEWLALGINRLSIGVQSLSDQELRAIGRDHNRQQVLDGLEIAQAVGFHNISIDLMYGLPTQRQESWCLTLNEALDFKLPHLSAYGLQLASNSALFSRFPRSCLDYPNEAVQCQMYQMLVSMTSAVGLVQYELSNFSLPGYQCRHNLAYWDGQDYLAFGVGAHRFVDGVRSSNWRSMKHYMQDWLGQETEEVIDQPKALTEAILLGLRKRQGINLAMFKDRFAIDLLNDWAGKLEKLMAGGFLIVEAGHLRLTQKGIMLSNLVLSELI